MSSELIEQMVDLVGEGYTPNSIWEHSLTWHGGSEVKVNKATTGHDPITKASISVPEGTVVTIHGTGGGHSGNDPHCRLPDGRQAIIPYYDLGEAHLEKVDDDGNPISEEITGAVAKVSLTKPLPQSAIDWVGGGYMDYGVELPDMPSADSSSAVTFLMKAEDEETLESAIDSLKKFAGASFKSTSSATLVDWAEA